VVQPSGHRSFYVTVGDLGTPDKAAFVGDLAKDAALKGLRQTGSEDEKHAAALMLKGQVVDARAMFVKTTQQTRVAFSTYPAHAATALPPAPAPSASPVGLSN